MSDYTRKTIIEKKYCPKCYGQYDGGITTCPDDGAELHGPKDCPLVGTVFAERYVIESVLGLGGMSIVYKAKHRLMNRTVAIKMLHKKLVADVTSLERFKLEAQAASSLSHPSIITVYDFGVTPDGEPFFVMDCLEGENLKELIDRKGAIPWERGLPIFKQICEGLDAAHKKGIVHRDLKPANVVLLKDDDGIEHVKLVDFGIAKILPQSGQQVQHLTQTGEVFGSPIYMSPEQCLGKELDTRSDLYALGCLMYEALVGTPPFLGDSFLETMNKHVSEAPKPMAETAPKADVPSQLEHVVLRSMMKDPADRFQSAGEVRDHLANISLSLLGSTSPHPGTISGVTTTVKSVECNKKNSPWAVAALVFAAVIVSAGAFATLWPGPEHDRGTMLNKMLWTFSLSQADNDVTQGNYAEAEKKILFAESRARTFGDNGQRLEAALKAQAALYDKWEGHAEDLEKTNNEISAVQLKEVRVEYEHRMEMLDSLSQTTDSAVQATNMKLRAEAQIPSILSTASRLFGRSMYQEDEKLLEKAVAIEKKMLDPDSLSLGPLETKLAECLIALRKFPEVRPYLAHAASLYKGSEAEHELEFVKVMNKLGQFDLDQNNFKDAEKELADALAGARKLKGNREELLLCLRSYADLLRQCGRKDESLKVFAEADSIEKHAGSESPAVSL